MNKTPAFTLVAVLVTLGLGVAVMTASCTDPPAPTVKPDIPVPSVPQFTLTYADHSYDIPTTTSSYTDPYTGKVTISTHQGYRVKNFTIDVTIKNQPYPPTINNGNSSVMRYSIQAKGHYEPDWVSDYTVVDASNSEFTVVSFPAGYPVEGKVDFRVMASLGYYYQYFYGLVPFTGFTAETSGWNTQTFTMPGGSPSPTVPEFPMLAVLCLLVVLPLLALVLRRRGVK